MKERETRETKEQETKTAEQETKAAEQETKEQEAETAEQETKTEEEQERKAGEGQDEGEWEEEFARQYNRRCGHLLGQERNKRGISRKALSEGLMDRSALADIEEGRSGWRKLAGDTMLQRMGVWPQYIEELAPDEVVDRWHEREEICLAIPDRPGEARKKLQAYRHGADGKSCRLEAVEEQFLLKAEAVLRLLGQWEEPCPPTGGETPPAGGETPPAGGEIPPAGKKAPPAVEGVLQEEREGKSCAGEETLRAAREAAACTMPPGWEEACATPGGLDSFWLAPGELEAVLLAAAAWARLGQHERARKLQRAVWVYPKRHQWDPNVSALILPQAAVLGMELALMEGDGRTAFKLGREALELLRRTCCHCHLTAVLECLGRIPAQGGEERRYLEQAEGIREAFGKVYERFRCPAHRIWQGIPMENTRRIGMTLWMLRQSEGIPRSKAVSDDEGLIMTMRQLEKVERGNHRPSYDNYIRLAKKYGKYGGWGVPMLETDSAETLRLRQEIATLVGFGRWDRAEWEIGKLRERVDMEQPRARQELLFYKGLYQWRRDGKLEEALETMWEALRCTIPDAENKKMEWWVYQQEEIIIASNIAVLYNKLERWEESKAWFETVLHSLRRQSERAGKVSKVEKGGKKGKDASEGKNIEVEEGPWAGIPPKGYEILMDGYDNLLADMGCLDKALKMDDEAIQNYLRVPRIRCLGSIFYRIAWNTYEIASCPGQDYEACRQRWKEAFRISEALAEFINDTQFQEWLEERKEKYLI